MQTPESNPPATWGHSMCRNRHRVGFLRSGRALRTGLPTLRPPRLPTWGTVAVDEAWTTAPSAVTHSDGVERDGRGRSRARCPGPIHGRGLESQDPWWVGRGQTPGTNPDTRFTASAKHPTESKHRPIRFDGTASRFPGYFHSSSVAFAGAGLARQRPPFAQNTVDIYSRSSYCLGNCVAKSAKVLSL